MWARIQNGVVAELTDTDPAGRFVAELTWVTAPAEVAAGWTYDGATFHPPAAPAPPAQTQLTPLEFMARFTQAESAAIAGAALGNAALFLWFLQAMGASYVDLTDARTKTGLDALVAAGLLTADREAAILTP